MEEEPQHWGQRGTRWGPGKCGGRRPGITSSSPCPPPRRKFPGKGMGFSRSRGKVLHCPPPPHGTKEACPLPVYRQGVMVAPPTLPTGQWERPLEAIMAATGVGPDGTLKNKLNGKISAPDGMQQAGQVNFPAPLGWRKPLALAQRYCNHAAKHVHARAAGAAAPMQVAVSALLHRGRAPVSCPWAGRVLLPRERLQPAGLFQHRLGLHPK